LNAELVSRERLGVLFGGSYRRRLLLAVALSIGLHEIAAGLVPQTLVRTAPAKETVVAARLLRVTVRPIPRPQHARVQPRPIIAHRLLLTTPHDRIALLQHQPPALSRPIRAAVPHADLPRSSSGKPEWESASDGAKTGLVVQTGNAAGSGNGSATQSGTNGAIGRNEPCGFVTFSDPHGSQYDASTHGFWVDIRMSVHFSDGSSQTMILDYPWYYPSEAANPWSDQNLKDPNFLPRFQVPPSTKADGEPQLVKYVMQHSTPDGLTLLHDCPTAAPSV
jgi:hypothetical protein